MAQSQYIAVPMHNQVHIIIATRQRIASSPFYAFNRRSARPRFDTLLQQRLDLLESLLVVSDYSA
jgi:hypothetical protein